MSDTYIIMLFIGLLIVGFVCLSTLLIGALTFTMGDADFRKRDVRRILPALIICVQFKKK
jgi:hypothetical protein